MPKLGNTVEECMLTTWLKHKGDTVAAGDIVAEVETDKASFEVAAPVDGILLDVYCAEGDLVPVFTTICSIGTPAEVTQNAPPGGADAMVAPQVTAQPPRTAAHPPRTAAQVPHPTAQRPEVAGPAAISPRARRFAREHDSLALPVLTGSGPGGRVLEADVRDLLCSAPPPAVRLSAVRQRIAARLRESLSATAQYTLNSSANAAGLLAARRALKANPATAAITINHLVVFCTIRALAQAPGLNAELANGMLRQHSEIHLAFGCDTDRGLMVPVVRGSQRLTLAELSLRMRQLADQAVAGTISPDDLTGGTFTVSNMGSLGVESFTPLLNPPQVAILGIGAIQLKPARKPDGNVEFIDSIGLSLTVDHQVIDGVSGARFLNLVAREITNADQRCARGGSHDEGAGDQAGERAVTGPDPLR